MAGERVCNFEDWPISGATKTTEPHTHLVLLLVPGHIANPPSTNDCTASFSI